MGERRIVTGSGRRVACETDSCSRRGCLHRSISAGAATRLLPRLRRGRSEFLEARIIPERIEHRIEPEQRRRERDARS
jgi:hypothetical protein